MAETGSREATAGAIAEISAALGSDFLEAVSRDDMDEAAIRPAGLLKAVEILRKDGFDLLLDIGCTDHLPLTPRFEVSYHLLKLRASLETTSGAKAPALQDPARFRLRVFPDDNNPAVPSLCALWPNANWAEREVWDLFGVRFDGHPDLRRILMPDDWQGHPLRKDYPLRGPERRFLPGGSRGPVPPVVTE